MNTIILCVGIPGSGKSTWTNKMLKNSYNNNYCKDYYYIVSRDKIRQSLTGCNKVNYWSFNSSQIEEIIIPIELFQLENLLSKGVNIIVDDTNSQIIDFNRIVELANMYNYDIKIKLFEIDILTAKERIKNRDGQKFLHFISYYHKSIQIIFNYIKENHKNKLI